MSVFNIDAIPTFTRPVTVQVPSGDGYEEQTFKATFYALDNDELTSFDLSTGEGTTAFFNRIVCSLDEIVGKDGPVSFSTELLDRLLRKQWARVGLMRAFTEAYAGEALGN